jgi:hypothetical protein
MDRHWHQVSVSCVPKHLYCSVLRRAHLSFSSSKVDSILQFRRAICLLKTINYPFSALFGLADTRADCIESAQEVYERLLLRTPNTDVLSFDVLALLGVNEDGSLDQLKCRELVRLFRPDRDGNLLLLDFVKSVDSVYKELRILRAAVANSSMIDHSFESIINGFFYVIVTTIILGQLGFDPLALFLAASGVVLGFAFMIGSASSKYFEVSCVIRWYSDNGPV